MNPTGAQIAALKDLRSEVAQRTGCPEWDTAGIRAALIATQGPSCDVSAAACLAAGDPSLRVPSERGFVSHWPKNATTGPSRSNNVPCVDHPDHDMPCLHRAHVGDMTREQISAAAAEIRAQLLAARPHRFPTPGVPKP